MRNLFVISVALVLSVAAPAVAQTEEDSRDDRGYLTGLIEDNLSGAGREVRITGFEGALSSRASMEEMTIADAEGIWLTLTGAVLDWNRSALLGGRLEVNEREVGGIGFSRLPKGEEEPPRPEASEPFEFKLPELPVSIEIASVKAERVKLGETIIGQEMVVKLDGKVSLAGGAGEAALSIERTDGADGRLSLDAGYDNTTGILALDLAFREGPGGIAASSMGLPGEPSVEMTVAGTGALTDYQADITLATDGQERLAGSVRLSEELDPETPDVPATRRVEADIGGDIAPLFLPEYREFFGTDVGLSVTALREPDGALRLQDIGLDAQSLSLTGEAAISPEGWPEHFSLNAAIRDPEGDAVLLPISGAPTRVRGMTLNLGYDAERDDFWEGRLIVSELAREDVAITRLALNGKGQIERGATAGVDGVTAYLTYAATEIEPADEALARALGRRVSGRTDIIWEKDAPVRIPRLGIDGEDYGLTGDVTIAGLDDSFGAAGRILLRADNISRFSDIAGMKVAGGAELDLAGQVTPLTGAFDLSLTGSTRNLAVGQPDADRLLRGEGFLRASVKRDTSGLAVRELVIQTPEIDTQATGRLGAGEGGLEIFARLRDIGMFVPGLNGPLSITGSAGKLDSAWEVRLDAEAPGETRLVASGEVAEDISLANLDVKGAVPLALANPFIAPRSLSGSAEFDVRVDGPPALSSISGRVTANDARLSDPDLRIALADMDLGVDIAGGRADLRLTGGVSSGGRFSVTGPVVLTPPFEGNLEVVLNAVQLVDPLLYRTRLDGRLTADGPLAGGASISGAIRLDETELRVPDASAVSSQTLPGLVHVNEPPAVRQTRAYADLIEDALNGGNGEAARAYPLNLTISAPGRIFIRGRGLDAELGGSLRLTGTTADTIPEGVFELVRGRLLLLGRRLTLSEGIARLEGDFTPFVRLVATSRTETVNVSVIVEGRADDPEVTFTSQPELPQDEVLAQLLFGRSIQEISPFQAARLASAVATLSGSGPGVLSGIREGAALDDLDVSTDNEGVAAVRAGKYISDNIYTNVEVASDGSTEVDLNLDITRSITARGSVDSEGSTGVGVFFEKDY